MRSLVVIRRAAGVMVAYLALAACASPDATIKADEFSEADTAAYLILTDQLQRVRNVREQEVRSGNIPDPKARVCVGILPRGKYGGIAPVPAYIVDRLREDGADADIKLDVLSSYECLVHYTRDDGPYVAEESDALSYAGEDSLGQCGRWFGGTFGREAVQYDVAIDNGFARLSRGRRCIHQYWIRT